jgi:hypothetical protein
MLERGGLDTGLFDRTWPPLRPAHTNPDRRATPLLAFRAPGMHVFALTPAGDDAVLVRVRGGLVALHVRVAREAFALGERAIDTVRGGREMVATRAAALRENLGRRLLLRHDACGEYRCAQRSLRARTTRKLTSAVAAQRERRRHAPTSEPGAGRLPRLVDRALTADQREDAAVEQLIAHALKRRRLLERVRADIAKSTPALMKQMVEILERIEDDIDGLAAPADDAKTGLAAGAPTAEIVVAEPAVTSSPELAKETPEAIVEQMAPLPSPAAEAPVAPDPAPVPATVAPGAMTEHAIASVIRRHDEAGDAARAALIERIAGIDAEIARLRPGRWPASERRKRSRRREGPAARAEQRLRRDEARQAGRRSPRAWRHPVGRRGADRPCLEDRHRALLEGERQPGACGIAAQAASGGPWAQAGRHRHA